MRWQRCASLVRQRVQRAGGSTLLWFGSLVRSRISQRATVHRCARFTRARCRKRKVYSVVSAASASLEANECRQSTMRHTARVPPDGLCCATGAASRPCAKLRACRQKSRRCAQCEAGAASSLWVPPAKGCGLTGAASSAIAGAASSALRGAASRSFPVFRGIFDLYRCGANECRQSPFRYSNRSQSHAHPWT